MFEGDVRLFPASDWKGRVDCIHAGVPCQPWSVAGKREGKSDERNLWPDTIRIIGEVGPRYVLLENVAGIASWNGGEYLAWILGQLAGLGYDCRWTLLGADQVGAPHRRERWWCLAYAGREHVDTGRAKSGKDKPGKDVHAERCDQNVAYAFNNGSHRQKRNEAKPGGDEQKDGVFVGDDKDVAYAGTLRRDTGWTEQPLQRVGLHGEAWDVAGTSGKGRTESARGQLGSVPEKDGEPAGCEPRGDAPTREQWGGRDASRTLGELAHGLAADVVRRSWWEEEPDIGRVSKGEENRVAKLKALGNGQVPLQAALAFKILMGAFNEKV